MTKLKFLHFADSHIDAIQSGKWDPETGLPIRVMDFLKSLETIVDAAIEENVDVVLFAGDAYKDRNPTPQYQEALASRILKLEKAKIPTFLLVGNHDMGALMKAHALTEFKTFNTEYVKVLDQIEFQKYTWGPGFGLISLPWVHKSQLDNQGVMFEVADLADGMDPNQINIFLGHCSVAGAKFSSERLVMLGEDLILPQQLLIDSGFDYVALGHIHKHQDLNPDRLPGGDGPPVIYPGSIERVDWGECGESKGFIIGEIVKGEQPKLEWRELDIRPMHDYIIPLERRESIMDDVEMALGGDVLDPGAMVRVKIQYPENWAGLINSPEIEKLFPNALDVQIVHDPLRENRARLDLDDDVASYSPPELLGMWMDQKEIEENEQSALVEKAAAIFEKGGE